MFRSELHESNDRKCSQGLARLVVKSLLIRPPWRHWRNEQPSSSAAKAALSCCERIEPTGLPRQSKASISKEGRPSSAAILCPFYHLPSPVSSFRILMPLTCPELNSFFPLFIVLVPKVVLQFTFEFDSASSYQPMKSTTYSTSTIEFNPPIASLAEP